MFKKSAPVLLLGSVMLAVSCASMAQGKGASKGGTSVVPTVAGSGKLSTESLIQNSTPMAGSVENAASLVNGLHSGGEIVLSTTVTETVQVQVGTQTIMVDQRLPAPTPPNPPGTFMIVKVPQTVPVYETQTVKKVESEKFTSPTGPLGLGNVDIALALTDALLTQQSVAKPASPRQLRAALIGDGGVLQLRASGMGWGDIAKQMGFELK